jgi:hypothetical protein
MNEQYDNPEMVERSDKDMNSPDVNSDPYTDKVPVDASLIHEAPWGETDVHETPMEEKVVQEMPMGETIVPETPMDVTIAHGTPMGETIVDETPMGETIVHETPMGETIAHETPMGETIAHEAPVVTNVASSASLLNREESELFRTRWNEIQGKFVDEPRAAVQLADALVSEVIEKITQMFANEHSSLEGQWNKGNDVSTEDLRKALQRYRSFFNRLVV